MDECSTFPVEFKGSRVKKQQVDTPYKDSWADRMARGFYKGVKVPQPSDHWVTLPGRYNHKGEKL